MIFKLPEDVTFIINTLISNGYEGYLVGGCVRDFIMNYTPHDYDITTSATPEEIKKIFKKTVDTGIKHGTVTVLLEKNRYEVTTYRIDGTYIDNRRPSEVVYTKNLIEDLRRRDFTMNAVAYGIDGKYIDPFNGIRDIQKKIIRAVDEPNKRFTEDGLRMLRAIRFKAQLNFSIEETTLNAIHKNVALIKNISVERFHDELIKLLMTNKPNTIIDLNITGLMYNINKDLYTYIEKNFDDIKIKLINSRQDIDLKLIVLLWKMDIKTIEKILKSLKFKNITINKVITVVNKSNKIIKEDDYTIRKLLNEINKEYFEYLIEAKEIYDEDMSYVKKIYKNILINKDCYTIKDLKITGNTLKSIGINEGKKIGEVLSYLLDKVLNNQNLNYENKLIQLAKEYME